MTVFKTFWKVVKKYKGTILLYTILLMVFGGLNMSTNDTNLGFVESKPDIFIVNEDEEIGLTKSLIDYMSSNANVIDLENEESALNDALFYREVNYIIYIPKGYRESVLNHQPIDLTFKSTEDYQASLARMMLERYLKTQEVLSASILDEQELIQTIQESLATKSEVILTSNLDSQAESQVALYFNFASYSIMAVVIFIICLVLSSFHDQKIHQRIIVSGMNYRRHNRYLLLASFGYAFLVWILFALLGMILLGDRLFHIKGLMYLFNAFIFTFVSLTLAQFISTLTHNKEAVSGIVNVVALGSAFLCGAFVPMEWLPESVIKFAHVLPSYWYIASNDLLKVTEQLEWDKLEPVFQNYFVLFLFGILFIILNNVVSKRKQRV